jgi:hypothetical protein
VLAIGLIALGEKGKNYYLLLPWLKHAFALGTKKGALGPSFFTAFLTDTAFLPSLKWLLKAEALRVRTELQLVLVFPVDIGPQVLHEGSLG